MSYSSIPERRDKVGGIAGFSSERHLGDTIRYTSCGYYCSQECILKIRIRDGVIISCEPDDTEIPKGTIGRAELVIKHKSVAALMRYTRNDEG